MRYDQHLASLPWEDYELLDSGEHAKLERFGEVIIARPETQALWRKRRPELWERAQASFSFHDKKGVWSLHAPVPDSWKLSWNEINFSARLTSFKHIGLFPEQAPNWLWASLQIANLKKPNVLNLFGYTGIA